MEFFLFALTVVSISLSGVLAPGPLLAVTIAEGKRNRFAGFEISMGHAMIEIPIILALYVFGSFADLGTERDLIALAGGVLMFYLAYRELRGERKEPRIKGALSGILMSALNPYFIVWWLTVGLTLVLLSMEFGVAGLVAFIVLHELCDFGWLGFVSIFSNRLSSMEWLDRILSYISSAILIVFGTYFTVTSLSALLLYF